MKVTSLFSNFSHIGPLSLPFEHSAEIASFYLNRPHVLPVIPVSKDRETIGIPVINAFESNWNGFEPQHCPFIFDPMMDSFSSLLIPIESPLKFLNLHSNAEITAIYANVIKWLVSFVDVPSIAPLFVENSLPSSSCLENLKEIYSFLYVFASELEVPIGVLLPEKLKDIPADFYIVSQQDRAWSLKSSLPVPDMVIPWMSEDDIEASILDRLYERRGVVAS